jgi:hypothetical protein
VKKEVQVNDQDDHDHEFEHECAALVDTHPAGGDYKRKLENLHEKCRGNSGAPKSNRGLIGTTLSSLSFDVHPSVHVRIAPEIPNHLGAL